MRKKLSAIKPKTIKSPITLFLLLALLSSYGCYFPVYNITRPTSTHRYALEPMEKGKFRIGLANGDGFDFTRGKIYREDVVIKESLYNPLYSSQFFLIYQISDNYDIGFTYHSIKDSYGTKEDTADRFNSLYRYRTDGLYISSMIQHMPIFDQFYLVSIHSIGISKSVFKSSYDHIKWNANGLGFSYLGFLSLRRNIKENSDSWIHFSMGPTLLISTLKGEYGYENQKREVLNSSINTSLGFKLSIAFDLKNYQLGFERTNMDLNRIKPQVTWAITLSITLSSPSK